MTKKRGRPPIYTDELFTQFLTASPQTPEAIRKKIVATYNIDVSWNTIQKYLHKLATSGVIKKVMVSRLHCYSLHKQPIPHTP